MDKRLNDIWTCLRQKVTNKTFFALIIPLFGFIVLVVRGAQWAIYEAVSEIKTEIAVHTEQMEYLQESVNDIDEKIEGYHPWRPR